MKCEHGVTNGCMACRPCQCGCKLAKHFIRYENNEGTRDFPRTGTGCTIHADCGGYLPMSDYRRD